MHCPHINLGPLHMRWDHWVSCRCTGSIKLYVSLCVCVSESVSSRKGWYWRESWHVFVGMQVCTDVKLSRLCLQYLMAFTEHQEASTTNPLKPPGFLPFLVVQMPLCFLSLKHFCGFRISSPPPFFFFLFFFKTPIVFSPICLTLLELFLANCPSLASSLFQTDAV